MHSQTTKFADTTSLNDQQSNKLVQKQLKSSLNELDKNIQDYFCYILLDFAVVDQSLEEAPLVACLVLSENLGIQTRFAELAKKELKITKKKLDSLKGSAGDLLSKLNENGVNHE